jgi:hypothetical protein
MKIATGNSRSPHPCFLFFFKGSLNFFLYLCCVTVLGLMSFQQLFVQVRPQGSVALPLPLWQMIPPAGRLSFHTRHASGCSSPSHGCLVHAYAYAVLVGKYRIGSSHSSSTVNSLLCAEDPSPDESGLRVRVEAELRRGCEEFQRESRVRTWKAKRI